MTSDEEKAEIFDEEILTWMTVQVPLSQEEIEKRSRTVGVYTLCLASVVIYAAVSKSFFAIRASLLFFSTATRPVRIGR